MTIRSIFQIHVETRKLPHFESFIVEDEEGSGIGILHTIAFWCFSIFFIFIFQHVQMYNIFYLMLLLAGGYGTVYRAQRKTDGKTFAIKCMRFFLLVLIEPCSQ